MAGIDHRRHMFADVYLCQGCIYRELYGEKDCEHIKYAFYLSKVQKALERKDWVVSEARKIIQKIWQKYTYLKDISEELKTIADDSKRHKKTKFGQSNSAPNAENHIAPR